MSRPIRLTVVMTHPVQYYGPWWRHIAARCPDLDLTVLYATRPTPDQQGVGFGVPLQWDVPLTEDYGHRILRPARPADSLDSDRFWGVDAPGIGAAIRASAPDVVLIAGWHSVVLVRALLACRRWGIPVLYRGDTHLGNAPTGWRRPLWAAKTWLLLRCFDGYLSVGRQARAYLDRFGAPGARIWSAPHCVDGAFFAESAAPHQTPSGRAAARAALGLRAGDFVVLFVGKLEPRKRPLDLVRAMARLRSGASLLVAGAGVLEPECREEASRLGVRVVWAGFVNQSELGRAYAAADCLVLPGDETWGLVANEALATGLPCVASDRVGCAADLVTPGETGEVFAMGDVAALASALERARAGTSRGRASACRQRAAAYSFERATSGLVAACRAVMAHPSPSAGPAGSPAPRVVACCGGMVVVGGLERMAFELLAGLADRGAAVHCIVNSWDNERIVARAREIGASWSIGSYRHRFERRARNPVKWARYAADVAMTSAGLLRDARRFRATHVLVPSYVTVLRNAPALAALRLCGVPVVFQVGNAPDPGTFYRRLWRWAVAPFVDRFVCNSRFTMQELLAHGVPVSKVSMIYNCAPRRVGTGAAVAERDGNRLVFVGQIIPGKGLDLLLDATALLVAAGHDVRLDVVGDIDAWEPPGWRGYHARVVARAGRDDLAGRVRFLGWRDDVPALLAGAAVHCCPSLPEIREAFGLVNVEAKEAGIPSVVCPTGALPELFEHGVDGWVCSEASAEALAEGIAHFLKDPERRRRAGYAARRSAERFSRDRFARDWWTLFCETRGGGRGSTARR